MGKLEGRIAVITGGANGQGAATARLFAAEGAKVVIADMATAEGEALALEIGDAAMFVALDVSKDAMWQSLVDHVAETWGSLDILINNAGIVHAASLLEMRQEDFERVLRVNLVGAWLGMKAVAPPMIARGSGAIVNVCSTAALYGMNGLGAYSASKWALRGLTKTAAMELGHQGVRVNAVFPGGVNTQMTNDRSQPMSEVNKGYAGQAIPRIGEPEEIAQASLFLASDSASYICGAELAVDGGMTVGTYRANLPGGPAI